MLPPTTNLIVLGLFATPALVALVFEPLPERIDLIYAVLSTAGFGSLVGSGYGVVRNVSRARRAVYAETGSLVLAMLGFGFFVSGALIQGVT
jgi:hypothetical protein